MSVHYLVAGSMRHAETTAICDWGWRPDHLLGHRGFRRPDGDFVIPISDLQYLRGVRAPSEIYLGYAAHSLRYLSEALHRLRLAGCKVHDQ